VVIGEKGKTGARVLLEGDDVTCGDSMTNWRKERRKKKEEEGRKEGR